MTIEEKKSELKDVLFVEFKKLYPQFCDSPISQLTLYASWLEDKLVEAYINWLDNKLSQPSTTTPSDDVAAGHGAC